MARFPSLLPLALLALLSSALAHELPDQRPHMVRLKRDSPSLALARRQDGLVPDVASGLGGAVSGLTGDSSSSTDGSDSSSSSGSGKDTAADGSDDGGGLLGGLGGIIGGDGSTNSSSSAGAPPADSSTTTTTPASTTGASSTTGLPSTTTTTPASSTGVSSSVPPASSAPPASSSGPVIVTSTSSSAPTTTSSAPASGGGGGGMSKTTIMAIGIVGGVAVGSALLWTIIRKTRFGTSKRFNEKLNPVDFGDEVPFPPAGGLHRTDSIGSSVSRGMGRDEKSDWGGRGGGSDWGGSQRGLPGHGRNGSGGTAYGGSQAGYAAAPMMGYNYPQQQRSLVGMDGIPRGGTPQPGYPYPPQQLPQQPTLPNPYDAYHGGAGGLNAAQSVRRAPSPANGDPYYRGGY